MRLAMNYQININEYAGVVRITHFFLLKFQLGPQEAQVCADFT